MTLATAALIQMRDIKKVFFTDEIETHALAGVHFDLARGEYVSISGPSGCGKSTLLSILGLLDTPTEGSYTLNNTSVEALNANERARIRNREIGFIFQAFNLIGDLSVFENVELPLTYRDGMGKGERKERVQEALARFGWETVDPARRRTDRQSRLQEWRSGDGIARRTAQGRRDHLYGHARSALRRIRRPQDFHVRRPCRR